MKRLFWLAFILCTLPLHATTYYIRHDGGTNTQCTGTTNAPYPGSGTGVACAYNHPYQLLNFSGAWAHLTNGDVITFSDSPSNTLPYYMGEQNGGLGTDWHTQLGGICPAPNSGAGGGFSCILPPFPNFVTVNGQNTGSCHVWNPGTGGTSKTTGGLVNPTVLSGLMGAFSVLNVQGTVGVTLNCIEITQPDTCVSSPASIIVGHCTNSSNFVAAGGLMIAYTSAQGPDSLTLNDFAAVGIASYGFLGSHLNLSSSGQFNAHYIFIIGNSAAGWNGDGGGCASNTCESIGQMNFDHTIVDWNGCMAVKPYTTEFGGNGFTYCYGQNDGGYGDGFVQISAGNVTVNAAQSFFRWNTQDGLDALHLSDDTTQSPIVNLTQSWSEGNGGQTFKIGSGSGVQSMAVNNVSVSNCHLLNAGNPTDVGFFSQFNNPVANATFTANNPHPGGSTFTGSGSGTTLTVTGTSGTNMLGAQLSGTGITPGTYLASQTSGATGGDGSYTTNINNSASGTITAQGTAIDITSVTGNVEVGGLLFGTGVPGGTTLYAQISGSTGGAGHYATTQVATVSSSTITSGWIPLDFGDTCRASGDQWSFQLGNGSSLLLANNSTFGYGATMWEIGPAGTTTPVANGAFVIYKNNLNVGYPDPGSGNFASGWFWGSNNFMPSVEDLFNNVGSITTNNLWFDMHTGCPNSTTPQETSPPTVCANPLIVSGTDLNNINPRLTGSSPAIATGVFISGITTDYLGNTRPNPPSIGAFESGGAPPSGHGFIFNRGVFNRGKAN